MQVSYRPVLTMAIGAGALLAASAAFAQSGPVVDPVAESAQAHRMPFIVEDGPDVIVTQADGTTQLEHSSTVTKFICGSDTANLTVTDLRRIETIAEQATNDEPLLITGSGLRGGLSITWNVTAGSPPAAVTNLLTDISNYFNSLFSDPAAITINFRWVNLGGGGVLGATSSSYSTLIYSSARTKLVNDMDADDVVQYFVPNATTIDVMYDATAGTVTAETRVFVTFGNREALGDNLGNPAATISINTVFPWDFDESNGVSLGTWGLQSVITHEVGHALGFTSGVDFRNNDMEMMDIYRFDRLNSGFGFNPTTFHEFEMGPRLVDFNNPNDRHNSDLVSMEYRMSDGSLDQASHFREFFVNIGLMDPALADGESFWPNFFKESDIDIFDAIGWDKVDGPCTTLGDTDLDGDVDLRDVQKFQECFDPGAPSAAGCECANIDYRDNVVNLLDWEVMERALITGP